MVTLFIFGVTPALYADPADRHLADLDTWLHNKDSAETAPAGNRLRAALKTKGDEGESLAQYLLEVVRSKKPRRDLFHLLSARAFSFDENRNIIPHLNSPYLKEFARMSIPDDGNHRSFRDACDILIQLEILKPGLPLPEAIKILGEPTHKNKKSVRWHLDTPRPVNPCLNAGVKNGSIDWFRNSNA